MFWFSSIYLLHRFHERFYTSQYISISESLERENCRRSHGLRFVLMRTDSGHLQLMGLFHTFKRWNYYLSNGFSSIIWRHWDATPNKACGHGSANQLPGAWFPLGFPLASLAFPALGFPLVSLAFPSLVPPWFPLVSLGFPPLVSLCFSCLVTPWFSLVSLGFHLLVSLAFSPLVSLWFPLGFPPLVSLGNPFVSLGFLLVWRKNKQRENKRKVNKKKQKKTKEVKTKEQKAKQENKRRKRTEDKQREYWSKQTDRKPTEKKGRGNKRKET